MIIFVAPSKIMNNKQIMYDCDKGYVLDQQGPPGATCIGGLWRPIELPACLLGQHPRLRWNRRRRNAPLSKMQKLHKFKEYLKKLAYNDLHGIRNNYADMEEYRLDPQEFLVDSQNQVERRKRDVQDDAYSKYMQKIQLKYRDFVKNLLGVRKDTGRLEDTYRNHLDQLRTSSRLDHPESENRHSIAANQYNSHYDRSYSELYPDGSEEKSEPIVPPISVPDITDRLAATMPLQKAVHQNYEYMDPFYQPRPVNYEEKQKQFQKIRKEPDIEELIAQLKSQTVRKKRDAGYNKQWALDSIQLYQSDDAGDALNSSRKNKLPKIPCEVK